MMVVQPHEIQGSDAWKEWRRSRGTASEVAALMGNSPWFPRTAYQLWLVKTGRQEIAENEAMRRGSRLEAPARAFLEQRLDQSFSPHVSERGRLSASLDGITLDGTTLLEIKAPMKGRRSSTWKHIEDHGEPPEHYWWQVQQQLLCSGAASAIFGVCEADGETITDAITTVVEPDESAQRNIEQAWEWFFQFLDEDTPPPADVIERDDAAWAQAAQAYRQAKAREAEVRQEVEQARKVLVELAGEEPAQGAGVKVQQLWVNGSIDYKAAVPEGTDLEPYRKPGRWQMRIDTTEDK